MTRCKSANLYKGMRPPTCNGGNPCDACKQKWAQNGQLPWLLRGVAAKAPSQFVNMYFEGTDWTVAGVLEQAAQMILNQQQQIQGQASEPKPRRAASGVGRVGVHERLN